MPFLCKAGTVRKRTWTNRQGDTKVAWFADYHDQHGKRHRKTFATKEAAKVGLRDREGDGLERRAEPIAEPNKAAIIAEDKAQGCIEIVIFLGRSKRQAAYLCRTGRIPAFKEPGQWCLRPSRGYQHVAALEDATLRRRSPALPAINPTASAEA